MSVNDDDDGAAGWRKKENGRGMLTRGCKVLAPGKMQGVWGKQEAAALLACQLKGKFDIR